MPDLTIRPTAKFIILRTLFAGLIFLALEISWFTRWRENHQDDLLHFLPIVAPMVFIYPAVYALRRQFTSVTVTGDRLRLETGALAKSTRTIQLSKVQDVRVDQRLLQRFFGVGNISIETAGEASRLVLENIDNPQAVADQLLDRAHQV
ncbi:MAG: rane-flanked domain [Candidatus Solibacter sp.]|nr:rane-flanked domain [Candidatus Solibacter sp.]